MAADRLVCFTDGVLEASSAEGFEFGQQGLRETVCGNVAESAEALSQGLLQAALRHAQGSLEDDATVLTIAVSGN